MQVAAAQKRNVRGPGGMLLTSLPVSARNEVCFNPLRICNEECVFAIFAQSTLKNEECALANGIVDRDAVESMGQACSYGSLPRMGGISGL